MASKVSRFLDILHKGTVCVLIGTTVLLGINVSFNGVNFMIWEKNRRQIRFKKLEEERRQKEAEQKVEQIV